MTRNKNRLLGRHFVTEQHFFFRIMIVYDPYIYGANLIAKFLWKSGFLRGVPWNPPWAPTGVKVPWSLKCKGLFHGTPPPPWAPTGVKVPWSLKCKGLFHGTPPPWAPTGVKVPWSLKC